MRENHLQSFLSTCSDDIPVVFLHYLSNAYHCLDNNGSICIGRTRLFSSMNGRDKAGISFAIFPKNHPDRYFLDGSWSGCCYRH